MEYPSYCKEISLPIVVAREILSVLHPSILVVNPVQITLCGPAPLEKI